MILRRPDNVTAAGILVCFFAVTSGAASLLGLSAQDGVGSTADALDQVVLGAGGVIMLIAGVNILRGENWARWMYLWLCAGLVAYDFAFLRDQLYTLVPLGALIVISIALLFLPNANRYYASAEGKF